MKSLRTILVGVTVAGVAAAPGLTAVSSAAPAADLAASPAAAPVSPSADGGSVAALPQSKQAAARYRTRIKFLRTDHTRPYKSTGVIRLQVLAVDGNGDVLGAVPNLRVHLYRKTAGSTRFKKVSDKKTSDTRKPAVRFAFPVLKNATYRLKFNGSPRFRSSSRTTSIKVYRRVPAKIDGSFTRKGRFWGGTTPAWRRANVYLQRKSCSSCAWRAAGRDRTGSRGGWTFYVGAPRTGRTYWRVMVPSNPKYIRSFSGTFYTQRS